MASIPEATRQHHKRVLQAQAKTYKKVKRLWAQVSPDAISETWTPLIPQAAAAVVEAQEAAAISAAANAPLALAEQGVWQEPLAFPDPSGFAGFASDGRDLDGLLYSPAVRSKHHIAGGMSVHDAMDRGLLQLGTLVRTTIADAGRQAGGVAIATTPGCGYIRMATSPSCPDCAILAGRFYRWNTGFPRHPGCDCVHVPAKASSTQEAIESGLLDNPYTAFNQLGREEQDRLYGEASAQAIRDGADIFQVVNAKRGARGTKMFTTEGTTRRGYAHSVLKPGQRRMTPEAIYKTSKTREQAIEALEQHGYILPGGQNPAGSIRGQRIGYGQFGHGGDRRAARDAVERALLTGRRDGSPYTMTAAELRVYEAERDWLEVLEGRNPYTAAAVERRGGAKIGGQDQPLTPKIAAQVELRYQAAIATNGEALAMRQYLRQAGARK